MLEFRDVTKEYGGYKVLNNINFEIKPNEIVGLLAPNGEGKSTIMKIACGIITDYRGEVLLNGEKITYKSRNKIAYMNDKGIIPQTWRVEEAVGYYNRYFKNYQMEKALNMIKMFNISKSSKVGALSLGNEEKLSLALTLGVDGDIFMLDEPLAAVDIIAREEILKAIITEFKQGSSIIISTHLIQDIERVFDRVLLLKRGVIAENKQVEEIREEGKSVVDFYKEVYSYGK